MMVVPLHDHHALSPCLILRQNYSFARFFLFVNVGIASFELQLSKEPVEGTYTITGIVEVSSKVALV